MSKKEQISRETMREVKMISQKKKISSMSRLILFAGFILS